MTWREQLHPRDQQGRFTDHPGGWAGALSTAIQHDLTPDRLPTAADGPPHTDWASGRWRVNSREHQRTILTEENRAYAYSPELADWREGKTNAEIDDLVRQQVDLLMGPEPRYTEYANGPHTVNIPKGQEDKYPVQDIMDTFDALIGRNPPPGRRNITVSDRPVVNTAKGREVEAQTTPGGNTMLLGPALFRSTEQPAAGMPSQHLVPFHVWALIHEYGHTLYPHDAADTAPIWEVAQRAAKDDSGMGISEYGMLGGPHEIFAESFAEWFVSGGDTSSAYARSFAEAFGWS
jgi:hypothetical protein